MKERSLTIQEIALVASTRVALGAGIGILLSDRLNKDWRKGLGWTLLGIGLLSTVPIVINIVRKRPVPDSPIVLAA